MLSWNSLLWSLIHCPESVLLTNEEQILTFMWESMKVRPGTVAAILWPLGAHQQNNRNASPAPLYCGAAESNLKPVTFQFPDNKFLWDYTTNNQGFSDLKQYREEVQNSCHHLLVLLWGSGNLSILLLWRGSQNRYCSKNLTRICQCQRFEHYFAINVA